MAVTPADLVAPKGELEPSLFPKEETLTAPEGRLAQYISEATALQGATDAMVKAWAYHRAFRAVYIRMSAAPVRASLDDQGSREFDKDQADRFLTLSQEWRTEYDRLVAEVDGQESQRSSGTAALRTEIMW